MEQQISHYFDGIFDRPIDDKSIEKFEYVAVTPSEAIQKETKNYTITHRDVDSWSHFAESFVKVSLRLQKDDASETPIDADAANSKGLVALQNGATNLFEKVELKFDNIKADTLEHPGIANQIKGLLTKSDDYKRSTGSSLNWYPDTSDGGTKIGKYATTSAGVAITGDVNLIPPSTSGGATTATFTNGVATPNTLGVSDEPTYNAGFHVRHTTSVSAGTNHKVITMMIPLKELCPMCENWTSPLRGSRASLHLIKNSQERMIHKATGADDAFVNILDLKWYIPLIEPSIEKQLSLEKAFNAGSVIPVNWNKVDVFTSSTRPVGESGTQTYRVGSMSSKPVRCWVGFQKADRIASQDKNSLIFDHFNVENIHMRLNSRQFPQELYEPDFTGDDYVRSFTSLMSYDNKIWDPQNGSGISYADYKNLYPLHYFDFTAQDSGLFSRGTTADLEVRYKMTGTTTETYHLIVVLESETGVEFTPIAENRVKLVQM